MKKLFYLVIALLSLSACTGAPLSLEGTKWSTQFKGEEIGLYFYSSDEVWLSDGIKQEALPLFYQGDERLRGSVDVFTYEYKAPKVTFYSDDEYFGEGVIKGNKMTTKELLDNDAVFTKK